MLLVNYLYLTSDKAIDKDSLLNELKKIGVAAKETADGLIIAGGKPHGACIETYNDHRIAMSFAIAGLAIPGISIGDSNCVGKSFPGFWDELSRVYED